VYTGVRYAWIWEACIDWLDKRLKNCVHNKWNAHRPVVVFRTQPGIRLWHPCSQFFVLITVNVVLCQRTLPKNSARILIASRLESS
ncbi:MAG: hypothetical protein WAX04_07505, partial [Oscillospiraceae bacterium]